ncbi:C39 family peptidase [Paenibacillus silviterrae]|uniref:C39 family peptidase n=1 Tax=Paenibacillus silviterrae TaxID=3242194 RepID=UPI002542E7A1|nr:C39 family peptidase [Paenibacillus chinjuensis]
MKILWKGMQVTFGMFLIAGLLFASSVFGVLLYARITDQIWFEQATGTIAHAMEQTPVPAAPPQAPEPVAPAPREALLDAPIVRQLPELPSGCEITSLTMLLQFYGLDIGKMELVKEMKRDTTPIKWNRDGSIAYWGNPNTGFVGDVTGNRKGFGIYHTALFETLKMHVPTAVDLTRKPFSELENQLLKGIPVVAWTTINYQVPDKWVTWDTPIGPIETTFMEHAVLLVGFDDQFVYVNDPFSGKSKHKLDKAQFISTWEAMGRQAISYTSS